MRKLWQVVAIACITIAPVEVASARGEDAIIECLIGKAAISLHKQIGRKNVTASGAIDAAMAYAYKRCKGSGSISEGGKRLRVPFHSVAVV